MMGWRWSVMGLRGLIVWEGCFFLQLGFCWRYLLQIGALESAFGDNQGAFFSTNPEREDNACIALIYFYFFLLFA